MFEKMNEDLTEFLSKNKKKLPDGEISLEEMMDGKMPPSVQKVLKEIAERKGMKVEDIRVKDMGHGQHAVEVIASQEGSIEDLLGKDHPLAKRKSKGLQAKSMFGDSLAYIAKELGVKPSCKDVDGTELKVGDVLVFAESDVIKTVLEVGFKFAILSHTDDQAKSDGYWYEAEIADRTLRVRKTPDA